MPLSAEGLQTITVESGKKSKNDNHVKCIELAEKCLYARALLLKEAAGEGKCTLTYTNLMMLDEERALKAELKGKILTIRGISIWCCTTWTSMNLWYSHVFYYWGERVQA